MMDPTQVQSLVQETELSLRVIRNSILVSLQEGPSADLNFQIHSIRSLRERASRFQLSALVTVLSAVEQEWARAIRPGQPLAEASLMTLLDLIAHSEAEVLTLHPDTEEQPLDLGDFLDNSFDVLQLDSFIQSGQPDNSGDVIQEIEPEDEFEPDEEMLEIFSMEAEELLGNIETNLEVLKATPENRDALWEVRRHAHTFKGAAGIIGLKKPSKLAHRIEDLLDHLSQNELVPSARILELIANSTTCLRTITKGDSSPETLNRTTEIYQAFDTVMLELSKGPEAVKAAPEAKPDVFAPPEIALPAVVEAPVDTPQPPRPIVRVSIARLDELVRIVRDLVVSRSMMEQRIAEFDSHLETMARTTRRLQSANAKIENDFEASMLGSPSSISFTPDRNGSRDLSSFDESAEFDSLELDRYTDFHQTSRELSEATQDCFATITALEALKDTFEAVFDDQRRLIEETQEKVMQIRLIRFGSISTRIERAVRVTCEEENKRAEIHVENQDVEIDTDLLDSLVEPLMHLIRNAVVHGLEAPETRRLVGKAEAGRITVRLANEETHIELKVSDDGRGISGSYLRECAVKAGLVAADAGESDLISMMCLPGLTTAEKLTMSAGRGVGMSIVKESVETRNGTLSVETTPQHGTTFTVRIPLAFAVAQALLVKADGNSVAIPLKVVKQITELSPTEIFEHEGLPTANIASANYQVRFLSDLFPARHRQNASAEILDTLLIETGEERFALVIDEVVKTEEIAIKPLGKPLDELSLVLGASVLGNGEVVPVLDVSNLFKIAPEASVKSQAIQEVEQRTRVLVVDDSPSVRHMTSKVVTAAGWEVTTAKDGLEALEMLRQGTLPDVILTDVEMPRMDGYELVSAVQQDEDFRAIPIVFITSRASEKHRERAADLGITEYLTKPFVESELVGLVERLCLPQPAFAT